MAYNTSESLIKANFALLTALRTALSEGRALHIAVQGQADLTKARYRMREILASCTTYPAYADGRFKDLAGLVRLSLDPTHNALIARRKTDTSFTLLSTLSEALSDAERITTSTHMFTLLDPDHDGPGYISRMRSLGWTVELISSSGPEYNYFGIREGQEASEATLTLDPTPETPFDLLTKDP